MNRRLFLLVRKEVLELIRDPKILVFMLIIPFFIFTGMGSVIGYTMEKSVHEALTKPTDILIIDDDGGWASQLLLQSLKRQGNITVHMGYDEEAAFNDSLPVAYEKYNVIIIIPEGFTANLTEGRKAELVMYSVIKSLGFSSTIREEMLRSLVSGFSEIFLKHRLAQAFPQINPENLVHPLRLESYAIVKGRIVRSEVAVALIGQSYAFIIGPIFLLSIGASLAAASIGVEKEEKTLETLLTLPIDRKNILFSKTVAAFLVAVLGTISMAAGLIYYVYTILKVTSPTGIGVNINDIIGLFGVKALAAVMLAFLLSLFQILVLSIILSSFASNIREAQMISGYIWIPILIPMFIIMYLDLGSLTPLARGVLVLLPFDTPLIILKETFQGGWTFSTISVAVNLVYLLLFIYAGARLFNSERILTARLRLRLGLGSKFFHRTGRTRRN